MRPVSPSQALLHRPMRVTVQLHLTRDGEPQQREGLRQRHGETARLANDGIGAGALLQDVTGSSLVEVLAGADLQRCVVG